MLRYVPLWKTIFELAKLCVGEIKASCLQPADSVWAQFGGVFFSADLYKARDQLCSFQVLLKYKTGVLELEAVIDFQ